MYDKKMLGLGQVQEAMGVMLAEANKNPDQPLAIAIVDDTGSIISYARMDRFREVPKRMAIRKAYTCALSGQDPRATPNAYRASDALWRRWATRCWPPSRVEWQCCTRRPAPLWEASG